MVSRSRRLPLFLVPLTAVMCCLPHAQAANVAVTSLTGTVATSFAGSNENKGWAFTANSNMTVTALGMWDFNSDGLYHATPVGIWNSTGTLLVSATVPVGTGGTLDNGYRYVPLVSGAALTAGNTYTIGAWCDQTSPRDYYQYANSGMTINTDPALTWTSSRALLGPSLAYPSNSGSETQAYFGPNFQFTTAIPEPSSLGLFALGLAGVAARRRK